MMHYTQYIHYHVELLKEFNTAIHQQPPFRTPETLTEEDQRFQSVLNTLSTMTRYSEHDNEQGQWLVGRVVSTYFHLMPLLARDLLWFFGGDCLHYMPDDEIDFYQQLDDQKSLLS